MHDSVLLVVRLPTPKVPVQATTVKDVCSYPNLFEGRRQRWRRPSYGSSWLVRSYCDDVELSIVVRWSGPAGVEQPVLPRGVVQVEAGYAGGEKLLTMFNKLR
jgi:hypothetical protein